MSAESLIGMHRLNPIQNVDDEVYWVFLPPSDDYYTHLLQDKNFKNFLMSDGTTKEGQDRIADFYQVTGLWKQMEKSKCNYERYFKLLQLDKMDSPADYLWVSFVEGLHRHAATILALLCTKFVDPKISPEYQLKQVMNGNETSKMLKNPFTVEVYMLVPKLE